MDLMVGRVENERYRLGNERREVRIEEFERMTEWID
jgi:hypothetical protein